MKIEAKILYSPDGNLGNAYQFGIDTSDAEWVLMLDHDVMIMHPNWYDLCLLMIDECGDAGLFTCYASKIGSKTQLHPNTPKNDLPLSFHRQFAKELFAENMFQVTDITEQWHKASGFFLLIKRAAFRQCGVASGFFGVDWNLKDRITSVGYKAYRIDGLYCYHLRDRCESWINGAKTSRDYDK